MIQFETTRHVSFLDLMIARISVFRLLQSACKERHRSSMLLEPIRAQYLSSLPLPTSFSQASIPDTWRPGGFKRLGQISESGERSG